MNEHNPYSPPVSPVADVGALELHTSRLRAPRYIFGVLVLLQFLATWSYASAYFELVRTGAVSFIIFLGAALGNLCLYGATFFVLRKRPRGQAAFIISAVMLGLSSFSWQWAYAWTWVIGFGALLSIGGVYLVRRSRAFV
jgi:hypothetical protein